VIFAPAITAPVASATVPLSVPEVIPCAKATLPPKNAPPQMSINTASTPPIDNFFIVLSLNNK
jgi:hypothetical protein